MLYFFTIHVYTVYLTEKNIFDPMHSIFQSNESVFQEMGFFIECGARDGEFLSSTLYFEREKNWTGLLIEANPMLFEELRQKHRKSWLLNACLNIYPYPSIVSMRALISKYKYQVMFSCASQHQTKFIHLKLAYRNIEPYSCIHVS